jgi:propanol-preferring alcohol dehydrogenase
MKAMILNEPRPAGENPLSMAELPAPVPKKGEVLLRVHVCGVCHTDLHTVEGDLDLPKLPVVPGHQVVATVEALGEGVSQYKIGDRVGVPWLHASCGRCEYCLNGQENLCDDIRFTGLHVNGGFAELMVAPADFAYPIPAGFPDVQAAPLFCAGIIGYRSLRLSEIKPGQTLGLYGFGASAHVSIQVARHWGCPVYVFTRSPEHRRHALELGAEWAGGAEENPPALIHAGVTFAPAGWIVPAAMRHLRKGGTLAINAIHMTPIPQFEYNLIYGERTLRSVANSTRQDAIELLELAAEIPIHTDVELFPLEDANEVMNRIKQSEIRGAAVLQVG